MNYFVSCYQYLTEIVIAESDGNYKGRVVNFFDKESEITIYGKNRPLDLNGIIVQNVVFTKNKIFDVENFDINSKTCIIYGHRMYLYLTKLGACFHRSDGYSGNLTIMNGRNNVCFCKYLNGCLHGPFSQFIDSMRRDCVFSNGELDGLYKEKYLNGLIRISNTYKHGIRDHDWQNDIDPDPDNMCELEQLYDNVVTSYYTDTVHGQDEYENDSMYEQWYDDAVIGYYENTGKTTDDKMDL